jgi:hypothetical protein
MKILTLLFLFLISNFSLAEEKKEKPSLSDLMNLEKQAVQTYQGYRCDVTWTNESPIINIDLVRVDNTTHRVTNSKSILVVMPKNSAWDIAKVKLQLLGLKLLKPTKYTENETTGLPGRMAQFDFYNSKNVIEISESLLIDNGFTIQKTYFTNGKPLNTVFFVDLKINQPFTDNSNTSKVLFTSLENLKQKYNNYDYSNHEDVSKLCNELIEKITRSEIETHH